MTLRSELLVLIGIAGLAILPRFAQADNLSSKEITQRLNDLFRNQTAIREKVYGNCRISGIESVDEDGQKKTIEFTYWSREGKYYRVDWSTVEGAVTVNRKLIVRPDGYTVEESTGGDFFYSDWGLSASNNFEKLFPFEFFIASTRGVSGTLLEVAYGGEHPEIFAPQDPEMKSEFFEYSKTLKTEFDSTYEGNINEAGNFEMMVAREGPYDEKYELQFDATRQDAMSNWQYEASENGGPPSVQFGKCVYDESSLLPIPSRVERTSKIPNGDDVLVKKIVVEIGSVDPTPQPMELFETQIPYEKKSQWSTRIALGLVGLMLLFAYVRTKRRLNT